MTDPRPPNAILLALLILGAALRLWGIGFGLPYPMTRPDEEFIVSVALRFFSGDFNPRFFEWPSLYFYVVHAVFRLIYLVGHLTGAFADTGAFIEAAGNNPTLLHMTLRLMSATAGVLTLLVVHGLAKALFDRTTALCATAFLAVAYLHVRDSHFGVLDVPLTLIVMSTIWLLCRAWQRPEAMVAWTSAGVCAGLATSVKYNAAALLVPALVVGALALADAGPVNRPRILAGVVALVSAFAATFLAGSPYVLLDYDTFREGLGAQVVRLTEGHGIRIEQVWMRHLTFSLWHGLGFPVLGAALAGAALLIVWKPRTAAFVLAFPVSYFLVIGSGHTAFIRYATPLVPFFCICAGYTVRQAVETTLSTRPLRVRNAALAVAVMLCAAPSLVTTIRFNRLLTAGDTRLAAADWLGARVKAGDGLYESGASYVRPHYAWPKQTARHVDLDFDPGRGVFTGPDGRESLPDWIVVAESPLRLYTRVPPELRGILNSGYELVETFSATTEPEPEASFDRQDAFFLPYADFSVRVRPGPQLSIYRRSGQAR